MTPCTVDAARRGEGLSSEGRLEGVHYNRRAGNDPVIEDHDRGSADPERIPQLLADWANRDPAARERLVPILYEELRRLAHHYMRGERAGHTLQTTALVNEVYIRLAGVDALRWRDRAHFFAMAATLMRRVLVDYARQRGRDKRDGGVRVTMVGDHALAAPPSVDIVALDDALERLSAVDPQQGKVVELRFFAGLSVEETAEALGISPATVKRDWATAKLWLYTRLKSE